MLYENGGALARNGHELQRRMGLCGDSVRYKMESVRVFEFLVHNPEHGSTLSASGSCGLGLVNKAMRGSGWLTKGCEGLFFSRKPTKPWD